VFTVSSTVTLTVSAPCCDPPQLRAWAASSKHRASIPAEVNDVRGLLDSLEKLFVGSKAPPLKLKLVQHPSDAHAENMPADGTVLKVRDVTRDAWHWAMPM
jgi:hypothetical protein